MQIQKTQKEMTPQQAYQKLIEGNKRFADGRVINRDLLAQAQATSSSQHPFAIALTCMDSRTSPEFTFDQGVGDIFGIRIAGNVLNEDILGGMEFGTKLAGANLIAVIGHTNCGAIRGACEQEKLGHLTGLLQKIQPAVEHIAKEVGYIDYNNDKFLDRVAKINVLLVMKEIQIRSPILKQLIEDGKLGIIGGIQELSTGRITFFDSEHIMPKE